MLRFRHTRPHIMTSFRKAWIPTLALAAICLGAFALRYFILLQYPAPPGADYGNYLTNVHAILGEDVTGGGVQYPAFFLLYLAGLIRIMGELPALQFSGPFLAGLTGFPMY